MQNIYKMDISSLSRLIKEKKLSPVDLTKKIIEEIKNLNSDYSAFITINEIQALNDAKVAEDEINTGFYKGELHGVPISIKDNISVKNQRLTNGSIVNVNQISSRDAALVSQLRSQGAIIIGMTNLDEFANNIIGINNNYGIIKNPVKTNYSAGGSSGGSAVSVAANLAYGSIGTDTAGSVRIPASCCGVFGLKPTYNLIPTEGITPLSWSLDHAGIIAKSCDDLSILFHGLVPGSKEEYRNEPKGLIQNLHVGVLTDYDSNNHPEVQNAFDSVINQLNSHGAKIKYVKTGFLENFIDTHLIISSAEAYYYQQQFIDDNRDLYETSNIEFFDTGKTVPKAQYLKALNNKKVITNEFEKILMEVDIIITPTLPILPPTLDSFLENRYDTASKLVKYTAPFNMSGLPALSIPYDNSKEGLPIGIQLIGGKYKEQLLLSISNWLLR